MDSDRVLEGVSLLTVLRRAAWAPQTHLLANAWRPWYLFVTGLIILIITLPVLTFFQVNFFDKFSLSTISHIFICFLPEKEIWLRCAQVWFSLYLFCLEFTEPLGYVDWYLSSVFLESLWPLSIQIYLLLHFLSSPSGALFVPMLGSWILSHRS